MRLFAAIYPPPVAVADLTARIKGLRVASARHARLADPANLHLTLAFLGEVPDVRLPDVESALASAARSARSPRLRLAGGGSFGQGRSTVLWVDVRGEVEALDALARSIRGGLGGAGLPCDDKPFRAHLTIARPGDRMPEADLRSDVHTLHDYAGPQWAAGELLLIRSHLGRTPRYTRVAGWALAAGG
ncbi:RNA 2',3'-cyclic phosphodiesterase [Micromonospora sp. C28ISP2-4]|uniref:RNA 2',3'-cyclic phosphodiesterase n=1 Tax=Micromonospora sp. C28ISP2-4 TaxID=3059523 RepID=UPI0026746F25|nr:RNA 2',3'-cyclic phosphodiesterase [Micromonospora sp. C28ISP2-4]MDO3683386.1 RNA 2',3'-cyclic phosphodiesterase [Micromonospora sp. C28ISP2-4]